MSEPRALSFAPPAGATGIEQDPVNVWFDGASGLLVDTGYAHEADWHEAVSKVRAIVVTHHHPDHAGGFSALRRRFPAALIWTDHVDPLAPPTWEGRWQLIAAPGHCNPHWVLWDKERRWLYTGDAILGRGTPWVGPPEGSMADYLATVERLRALGAERVFPGHGPVVGPDQIEWTLAHRRRRLDQVMEHIARGVGTVTDLVEAIYIRGEGMHLAGMHRTVAEWTVRGYLDYLVAQGRAQLDEGRWTAKS